MVWKRLSLLVVFASAVALGLASAAPASSIDDGNPCPRSDADLVCPTGTTGVPYSIRFHGFEVPICRPGDDKWSYENGTIPPGLTLASDGTLSGTPTQAGAFGFWLLLRLPDIPGECSSRDNSEIYVRISIVPGLPKLTLGPETTAPATVGKPYSLQMTSTVSDAKTFSISVGALPPGLNLNAASGLIYGTPTTSGTYGFTVYAKVNADSRSDTKAEQVVVRSPLAILGSDPFTSTRKAQAEVSIPFEATLTAQGGSESYTWALASGALPPGVPFANGAIAGRPTAAGAYRFTASATDSEGRVATYPGRIVVSDKLAISTLVLKPATVGSLYHAKLATLGGSRPSSWRIFRGRLPKGMRLDRTVGTLHGIPRAAGISRVTFEASDSLGVVARKTLRIVVAPKQTP